MRQMRKSVKSLGLLIKHSAQSYTLYLFVHRYKRYSSAGSSAVRRAEG